MNNLSEIIRMQRNLKKLTQAELAEYAEVNVNTIVKIEKDENKTSIETMRKILDVMDLDLAIVPKRDTRTRFMETYYPHLKESNISRYILRLITEIEKYRAMDKKNVIKIDVERLIVRMYDPELKTEEGQNSFYRALKALPDVTKKMCGENVIFWSVESVDMNDGFLMFNCKNKGSKKKNGLQLLPSSLTTVVDKRPENIEVVNNICNLLKNLSPREKVDMMDIFYIDDNDKRKDALISFLKEKGLGEEEIDVIVHNLDKHSIKGLVGGLFIRPSAMDD